MSVQGRKNDTGSLLKSFLISLYQIRSHFFDEKENVEHLKENLENQQIQPS